MKTLLIFLLLTFSLNAEIFTRGEMIYEGYKEDALSKAGQLFNPASVKQVLQGYSFYDENLQKKIGTYISVNPINVKLGVRFGADNNQIGVLSSVNFLILRTGQVPSYCIYDDGQIRKGFTGGYTNANGSWNGSTRFTDNGDNTVTDNITGLMWLKDANFYGTLSWTQALSNSANCTVGGYTDWRLPNRFELESLLDLNESYPFLSIGNPFENVGLYHWSSNTDWNNPTQAWYVDFQHGRVNSALKTNPNNVWYCRTK